MVVLNAATHAHDQGALVEQAAAMGGAQNLEGGLRAEKRKERADKDDEAVKERAGPHGSTKKPKTDGGAQHHGHFGLRKTAVS